MQPRGDSPTRYLLATAFLWDETDRVRCGLAVPVKREPYFLWCKVGPALPHLRGVWSIPPRLSQPLFMLEANES